MGRSPDGWPAPSWKILYESPAEFGRLIGCRHEAWFHAGVAATRDMRVTLVTETYFPQVNGVSRTLGELVRFLKESGDEVQLISPGLRRGRSIATRCIRFVRSSCRSTRSFISRYRRLARVHRAIESFQPDIVHIATEATLGWSVLAASIASTAPGRIELSHQFRSVQPALPGQLGASRDLAVSALVSQQHAGNVCSFGDNDRRARAPGASSGWCCGSAGLTVRCFGPIGRVAWTFAGRWDGHPTTW